MKKRSAMPLSVLALAAAGLLAPLPAFAQQEGIQVVSNRVMDTLEAWSSPSHSLEDLATDTHPELIGAYLPELADHYGGQPLSEVFADQLPATAALFAQALFADAAGDGAAPDADAPGDDELLAFAMALGNDEYQDWQSSLAGSRRDFAAFVNNKRPDVVAELEDLNRTPAEQGIGLLDYVNSLGDPTLADEFAVFVGPVEPRRRCTCRVVTAFTEIPAPWTLENNENYYSQWGHLPKKMRTLNYHVNARGAARAIDLYRVSEQNLWEVSRDKTTNQSSLRVRMLCTIGAEQPCIDPVCYGQLALRIGYASRVYERHDASGPWSKQSQALTGDLARLSYTGPASLPSPLFEKGVAVAGQFQTSWNPQAVANLLFAAAQVTLSVVTDNASSLVDADLASTTVSGIAGLITHSGSPGNTSRDMMAAWDNSASSQMITLMPNQTHLFELAASSKIYSRGYGKWSWTWGNLDSANYFVGVARHFQCAADVVPPPQNAFWLQAGAANAPYSPATLQGIVGSFIQVELGQTVPPAQLANTIGVYP